MTEVVGEALVARHIVDFASVVSDWYRVAVSAGPSPSGGAIILAMEQKPYYLRVRESIANSAGKVRRRPTRLRVYYEVENGWAVVDIAEAYDDFYRAQPLPQGEWLIVRPRAADDSDGNGDIYSAEGKLLASVPLGYGITDVQTTQGGQIWVSYFDEGVFGSSLLGTAGLGSYDSEGVQRFNFNATNEWMIADCYAFNVVSNKEVWLCPYTDFPLVRLQNEQIRRRWDNNPIKGADAFAVWKSRVLFTGGYGQKDKLFIVNLYQSEGEELAKEEHQAVTEDGAAIKFVSAFGRGSRLYLVTTDSLYSVDLQET